MNKYYIILKELLLILNSLLGSLSVSYKIVRNKEFNKLNFHPLAGKIIGPVQYLFDGSKISYPHASDRIHNIYRFTQGAPEPEEISIFLNLIKKVNNNGVMIEIGAGQGFYSIIGSKFLTKGKFFLIEANPKNIFMLNQNMILNKYESQWKIIQNAVTNKDNQKVFLKEASYASAISKSGEYTVNTLSIDTLVRKLKLKRVNLLQMDIQGEELKALQGMKKTLSKKLVDNIMIATHSVKLHENCKKFLINNNYKILLSQDIDESSSYDGILVAELLRSY